MRQRLRPCGRDESAGCDYHPAHRTRIGAKASILPGNPEAKKAGAASLAMSGAARQRAILCGLVAASRINTKKRENYWTKRMFGASGRRLGAVVGKQPCCETSRAASQIRSRQKPLIQGHEPPGNHALRLTVLGSFVRNTMFRRCGRAKVATGIAGVVLVLNLTLNALLVLLDILPALRRASAVLFAGGIIRQNRRGRAEDEDCCREGNLGLGQHFLRRIYHDYILGSPNPMLDGRRWRDTGDNLV